MELGQLLKSLDAKSAVGLTGNQCPDQDSCPVPAGVLTDRGTGQKQY